MSRKQRALILGSVALAMAGVLLLVSARKPAEPFEFLQGATLIGTFGDPLGHRQNVYVLRKPTRDVIERARAELSMPGAIWRLYPPVYEKREHALFLRSGPSQKVTVIEGRLKGLRLDPVLEGGFSLRHEFVAPSAAGDGWTSVVVAGLPKPNLYQRFLAWAREVFRR